MKWRDRDGKVRKHPHSHHAHSKTGQPIYHEEGGEHCIQMPLHGVGVFPLRSRMFGAWTKGGGRDHHDGLDHFH